MAATKVVPPWKWVSHWRNYLVLLVIWTLEREKISSQPLTDQKLFSTPLVLSCISSSSRGRKKKGKKKRTHKWEFGSSEVQGLWSVDFAWNHIYTQRAVDFAWNHWLLMIWSSLAERGNHPLETSLLFDLKPHSFWGSRSILIVSCPEWSVLPFCWPPFYFVVV